MSKNNGSNGDKRSIGELHLDTRLLIQKLSTVKPGEVITYEQLADVVGREVRPGHSGYSNLFSARRSLVSTERIVFDPVPRIGLERLTDAGIVKSSIGDLQGVHRAVRKSAKKLGCAEYNNLSPQEKTQHNVHASQIGVLAHISSARMSKKLEAKIASTGQSLPLAKTLEECK